MSKNRLPRKQKKKLRDWARSVGTESKYMPTVYRIHAMSKAWEFAMMQPLPLMHEPRIRTNYFTEWQNNIIIPNPQFYILAP